MEPRKDREEEKSRTDQMVDRGLDEMEKRYGEESQKPKKYHNEKHALRIVLAAETIGKAEGLSEEEIGLLRIAAAWHDVETGLEPGENEDESARLCQNEMSDRTWGEVEVRVVGELIRSTKFTFGDGGVILQMVGDEAREMSGKYRVGLMKRIMADADISACGADWEVYKSCGLALGRETSRVEDGDEEGDEEFWKWQLGFLDGLLNKRGGFYTQGAKMAFPHMAENLESTRQRASPGGA